MLKRVLLLAGLVLATLLAVAAYPGERGSLRIRMTNVRNDLGKIRLALYRSGEGWPADMQKAYRKEDVPIRNGEAVITFDNLPYGPWGVIVYHDENDNDNLDQGFLGIPKEGYGASNDARAVMAPPSFEKAKVVLNQSEMTIRFQLSYVL